MGRHILCDGDSVYAYRLGKQDSDLCLIHTVFHLGDLERSKEDGYPIDRLHLTRDDAAPLEQLLELDDLVTQRQGFKDMVRALLEYMEETGRVLPSFAKHKQNAEAT